MTRRVRALLVGPLPRAGTAIGGTQVSFQQLVERLRARGHVDVEIIDTTRVRGHKRAWERWLVDGLHAIRIAARVYRLGRTNDVIMFNASSDGFLLGGSVVSVAAKAVGRPLIARAFGGGLDEALASKSMPLRWLARNTVLRADLVLLQTRALCESLGALSEVRHLPTSRVLPSRAPRASPSCRKFLMLAQLRPEKGYGEALAAIERLPDDCSLTIAGPAMPGTDVALLRSSTRARWIGDVAPSDVSDLLAEHDALVLPTYHSGEGIPGSIIEAFQHGLPVVATRWRALPELVQHAVNGLLVEPRDVEGLANAMRRLAEEPSLFTELRDGALSSGREHSAEEAAARVECWLSQLAGIPLPASKSPLSHDAITPALPTAMRTEAHRP